jgi:hypothetical protein
VAAGEGQVDGRLRSLLERISRAVPEQRVHLLWRPANGAEAQAQGLTMPRVPKNDRKKARHWIPCPKCSGEGKRLNTKGQMAVCPTCHGMKGKYV